MNAHIERLAREAGITKERFGLWNAESEELEAFAKAIAEDCAKLCDNVFMGEAAVAATEIRERYK